MVSRVRPAQARESTGVKSAVRTLEILEYFDEVRQAQSVVNLAIALGYPQSSTAALLRSLTACGYLHFNEQDRTYIPTDRVPILGSWVCPSLFEDWALPRLMQAIVERTGQFVLLAARNGDFAQYIYLLSENKVVAHPVRIGEKRELAKSGVGQVLLSSMSDGNVKRLYHRINAYSKVSGKVDVAELLTRLYGIRERGYVFSKNRVVDGYGQVAFPVPQRDNVRPLAIGVGGSSEVIERLEGDIVRIVQEEMGRHLKKIERPAHTAIYQATVPSPASTVGLASA